MGFRGKAPLLCLLILFVLEHVAGSDFLSPILDPLFDKICKGVSCGKGSCKRSNDSFFSFECQCDAGWKRPISGSWTFMPCVIPNCTLDSSCGVAAPPTPDLPRNSIIDPCTLRLCGGGTCVTKSNSSYTCSCNEGYANLFNDASSPCVRNCNFGADCLNLGLSLINSSAPASSPGPPSDTASGGDKSRGHRGTKFQLLVSAATILPLILVSCHNIF